MLRWFLLILVVALVLAVFGFGGILGALAFVAKVLFYIVVIILLVYFIRWLLGGGRRRWRF